MPTHDQTRTTPTDPNARPKDPITADVDAGTQPVAAEKGESRVIKDHPATRIAQAEESPSDLEERRDRDKVSQP